ncbi:Pyridoxal 4-dehydrogenase [Rhodobacteraceae bacterium THAF1]|uniref:aldo/keto reductase n=1 Tax=Palleronia sp. THAF1 TaxID=2587842 RepID=UPI000F3EE9BB|nr:aldo/keto reductase [Palleronia sp. THAF1]QFU07506.1 Pyridoxal 4-dehydrogenase [Palleronia sp. THAF1]VDC20469.1 Pyridoxal 4-dehydrogenase [Rhodobacteraceae bacterium THAF1]
MSRYTLPHTLGMGGAALGNEFRPIPDATAMATLNAAWDTGIRYFDVAPHYGLGLAERRFGQMLHQKPRDSFVISSKVGRLLQAGREHLGQQQMPFSPSPNVEVYDYSRDGVMRSIEDSLQRTGLDHIDIVFVHDLSPDNDALPDDWDALWPGAVDGGFRALCDLRDQGVIDAWGMGVNRPEPILRCMKDSDPDIHLLASQFSLIEHDNAVTEVFPAARKRGNTFVIGSALNAGFLAGRHQYHYGDSNTVIAKERMEKRDRFRALAFEHGSDLLTAAIRFAMAQDVCASLCLGLSEPHEAIEDVAAAANPVSADFWQACRDEGLIHPDAATPD